MMINFKFVLIWFLSFTFVINATVELGVDRFFKDGFNELIRNKKIGIVTNQTGVDSNLKSTINIFIDNATNYKVQALFAPEHGLDGKEYAGEKIKNTNWGKDIHVYSLHGETRRPTKEMLDGLDVIIYDIQDIGCRSYTYCTTLFYVIEEAAKYNITVIVLDRPNPINGIIVDGPMIQELFRSYVGYINVPYCHGMTIGELAILFNKEYKIGCNIKVVQMHGWDRKMSFKETKLNWIPTSPQMPESDTPYFYASTGILGELGIVNIGVGYTLPFKVVGAPWIDADLFAKNLNQQKLPGVLFVPFHYRPFYGSYKEKTCHGVLIKITDEHVYKPLTVQYCLIGILKTLYKKEVLSKLTILSQSKRDMFNKVNGNDVIFKYLINEQYPSWKLIEFQKNDRQNFLKIREKYLLY